MQIDGPWAQLTAPGIEQLRRPQPGQQRPQEDYRGTHLPHEALGNIASAQGGGVDDNGIPLPVRPAAQQAQDVQGGGHVRQVGAVMDHALPGGKQAGGQNGQDAVLAPVDGQGSAQGPSALNFVIAHGIALLSQDSGYPMQMGKIWFIS